MVETNIAAAGPQRAFAQQRQLIEAFGNGQYAIAGELARRAAEPCLAIGNQNFSFTDIGRIKQDLARLRPADRILRSNAQVEPPQGNPASLAAPARVEELPREWQY